MDEPENEIIREEQLTYEEEVNRPTIEEDGKLTYEEALKRAKKKLKPKKAGRPKLTLEEKKRRKIEREAQALLTNQQRTVEALNRPRVGGRFVSLNPEVNKAKEARNEMIKTIDKSGFISDEDREFIGTDSRKFFERAMQNAQTWVEGMIFAKELKPLQHASLSSQQITQEVVVTQKVLKWQWDEPQAIIDVEPIERLENNDDGSDRSPLQADAFTSENTQELEKV